MSEYIIGDRRGRYKIFVENPKERDHLEDLGVDKKIIVK
jgi:hypothetical protein